MKNMSVCILFVEDVQDSSLIRTWGLQPGWEGRLGDPCEAVFAWQARCLFAVRGIPVAGGGSLQGPTPHDTAGPPVWFEVSS